MMILFSRNLSGFWIFRKLIKSLDFCIEYLDVLFLTYDMMISPLPKFIRFFLSTRIFLDFHQFFRFLHRMYDLFLTYDMMISFSGYFSGFYFMEIEPVSGFLSILKISWHNGWFTTHIWYDDWNWNHCIILAKTNEIRKFDENPEISGKNSEN